VLLTSEMLSTRATLVGSLIVRVVFLVEVKTETDQKADQGASRYRVSLF
jgi:hypothetical protein